MCHIQAAVTSLLVSEPRKPSWLLPWKAQRLHSPAGHGAKSSSVWGSRKFCSPGTSLRSSVPLLPLSSLLFFSVGGGPHLSLSQHHILLMAKGSFPSADKKPWPNLGKKIFAVVKELWSRTSLKWKSRHKTPLHNTLCSAVALALFCWLELGWHAGIHCAKSLQLFGWDCPHRTIQLPLHSLSNT